MNTAQTAPMAAGESNPLQGVLLAAVAFFLFASTDAIIKTLTGHYSIFQIASMQVTFACIPLAVMLIREGGWVGLRPVHPRLVALRGFLAGIGTIFGYYAFSTLPLAEVYAIAFGVPIVVTILSIPVLKEQVGAHRWSAVLIGFVGILVMVRPGSTELSLGHLAAVAAMLNGAVITLILRKIAGVEHAPALVSSVVLGMLLVSLPGAVLVFRTPELPHLALLAASGLLMGTAQFVMLQAFRRAPAASVAPMQYTMMVWALLYGVVIFGDSLRANLLLGAAIVMASSLYIMHRERVRRVRQ
jgi:drug/metabolite transporter (DMT)-like permease